ncbi:MAG: isochorismatase family cysteine hydrolase [Angelakisella sp.]|nr:isochorismatase family cysteine hydrolase [Angelakisella sp.]
MSKVLVVVDFQKDFVDGALGFAKAQTLEEGIAAKVADAVANNQPVVFTLDTHGEDYLETREGRHLPVPHCTKGDAGWRLYGKLEKYMEEDHKNVFLAPKYSFGAQNFSFLKQFNPTEIELVGVVTNMCVISNAVILQTAFPQAEITIDSSLCASFDDSMHQKALDIMAGLQMNIL